MAYFAPYIDATGLHIPTYNDILENLIQNAKNIFGQDIYLGTDSQDYQFISIVAAKIFDALQVLQFVYDSRSPATAIGSGLDVLVKVNGIARNQATYSTCTVILSGTPNTQISNGVVKDKSGYTWNLPSQLTIGSGGTVNATATCQNAGPIYANPGDINEIVTPMYGWTSVTNSASATPGVAIETDSQLRSRQAISTAQSSRTLLEGTKGAIAAVSSVTRFKVYENDTSVSNANGLPPNSITSVVEGGLDLDIATAIFNKKGPGCFTNGTTQVVVSDKFGQTFVIGFYRPTYDDIDVTVNVKKLSGYTTQDAVNIQNAVANFLNTIDIGDDLPNSSLWGAALSALNSLNKPTFSITSVTSALHGQAQSANDITIAFNEVTRGDIANIVVNAV